MRFKVSCPHCRAPLLASVVLEEPEIKPQTRGGDPVDEAHMEAIAMDLRIQDAQKSWGIVATGNQP